MSIFDAIELERLLTNLYSGAINERRLPVDLYKYTLNELMKAVYKGFGNTTSELADNSPELDLLKHYEYNIAIFSGAKTFQQIKDMSSLVFTENGYKRDYSEFKRIVTGDQFHEGIFQKYNKNYLKTEYNTAISTAQMGREWLQIEDEADIFPYLKYVTAHDERVRHTHQQWDGVIRPVGDAFWTTHVPPNGFNCRCRLVQLNPDDDVFSVTPDDRIKDLPPTDSPLFQRNPAKTGYIFDPSIHPYTKNIEERFKVDASVNFGFPTPKKPNPLKQELKYKSKNINSISNYEDLKSFCIEKYGLSAFDLSKIKFDISIEQMKQFDILFDEYKIEKLVQISTTKSPISNTEFAHVSRIGSDRHTILNFDENKFAFNKNGSKNYLPNPSEHDIFLISEVKNYNVLTDNPSLYVITHEFAHLFLSVKQTTSYNIKEFLPITKEIKKLKTAYKKELNKLELDFFNNKYSKDEYLKLKKEIFISEYADTNSDEFFAESFAMYKLNATPSKYAVKIGELIDKNFKK